MNRHAWHFGISLLLMCTAWAGAALVESRPAIALAKPLDSFDRRIDGWVAGEDLPLTSSVLETLRPTSYILRTYQRGQNALNLFIAYYALTQPGESMHSPKNCLPGGGWEILQSGFTAVQSGGKRLWVNKYIVQKEGDRLLVLYWYQSKRRVVASEYEGKLLRMWDAVRTGDTSGSIVRVSLAERPGALEDARSFATAVFPEMQRALGR
jgi:EpsI family protein